MVPILGGRADWLGRSDDAPHRTVALRHAAIHRRPGLWGDDPDHPSSVAWLREGDDGQWEAFGAGDAGPALDWIAARAGGRPVALMAPPSWEGPVLARAGRLDRATVLTWSRPDSPLARPGPVGARRLGLDDAPAFEALAPRWALRSWGGFGPMIERGAAFGVPSPGGLAASAWIYESDDRTDKIGVATAARARRLGLGFSAASALLDHVLRDRRQRLLWTTHAGNPASIGLARALGFSGPVAETLLRWTPSASRIAIGEI